MKFYMILFFLLMVSYAQAETFKIAGSAYDFKLTEGLLLKGCEKDCEALKVIKKHKSIDLAKLRGKRKIVNSTGSDTCALAYQASAVIGVAENKDQRAFCVFKDGSMVELNSLSVYLEEKGYIKKSPTKKLR